MSVSYTHLDVYKRQQVAAVNAALNSFNKELLAEHIRNCVVRDIREGKDETVEELVVIPVSYTHLDVYKRQGYYHIGEGKLRMLIDGHPNEDFYVMNGNRALIKREKFERYLDQATAV